MSHLTLFDQINEASRILNESFEPTPLQRNEFLSQKYGCNVYLKREDLQVVRSFKIRGSYYFIQSLTDEERRRGVVCASAGNHAQGVAYSCRKLEIHGKIFMPATTPSQKVTQVKFFGGSFVDVILTGDTFDDSSRIAQEFCREKDMVFVHPFDDYRTIAGQGSIGMEIMQQMPAAPDYVFGTIGGGGLLAGVGTFLKETSPNTKIVGVEPEGAAGMYRSFEQGRVVTLDKIDKFVDGAAVKQVGQLTYDICRKTVDDIILLPNGKECTTILELYNNNAIVLEPAGALPVAALDLYKGPIQDKNVVCIVSGSNNDIERMQEIKERSLIYEGLKHYFLVDFPQRAGALREFLEEVLGPNDDITRFEYTKKNNRDTGPALVGIELSRAEDYGPLIDRLSRKDVTFVEINKDPKLFSLLV